MIKRRKIRVGDISISYLVKEHIKAAHTVLFVHGFPFNKNMWEGQLAALPDELGAIAPDVRGHGNSTSGHGFFSVDVFARDLLGFIGKLGLDRVILCGISMGGYIALRAFEIDPSPFAGIILSDTNSLADDNAAKLRRFEAIQMVLKEGRRNFSLGFIKNIFAEKTLFEKPEVIELIKSSIRRNTERDICATLLALASRTDTTAVLSGITVPSLVIRGAADLIMTTEQAEILTNKLPAATFAEVPGSAHLPNLENPIFFNQVLNDYLARF